MSRYEELAEKWLNGTITPEEEREFAQWFQEAPGEVPVPPGFAASQDDLRERMLSRIHADRRPMRRLSPWKRIAVAAAVLMAVATPTFLVLSKKSTPPMTLADTRYTGTDVLPGTDGATLTLASGQQLILDTLGNGRFASEQTTDLLKTGGQIFYMGQEGATTDVLYNTLTTSKGRQFQVVLADGTKAWLNAESSIRYPVAFGKTERNVSITGEVYFEVAKDASRPFTVDVDGMGEVRVLGTHFNINAYRDEPEATVTLLEGSIQMKDQVLKPGEQATVRNGTIRVAPADGEEAVAWKNGKFQYMSTDLPSLLRQLARWYDVDLVYEGVVPDRKFFVIINRSSNLSDVLGALQANDVKFQIEGKHLKIAR